MREITAPYLVIDKVSGKPVIIQRDGYYPPEVLSTFITPPANVEQELINSGFYNKIVQKQ